MFPSSLQKLLVIVVTLLLQACRTIPAPLHPNAIRFNTEGTQALADGDLETANAKFGLAIEYHPRFVEAWVNRGLLALQRNDFRAARADLLKARHLNEDIPAPHHALGLLALAERDSVSAQRHFEHAIEVDPAFAPARLELGKIAFVSNSLDEAREQFLRGTVVAASVPANWTGLYSTLVRLGRDADAKEMLGSVPSKLLADPSICMLVARQEASEGQHAQALNHFRAIANDTTLSPSTRSEAFAWSVLVLRETNDRSGANLALRSAKELDASNPVLAIASSLR